MKKLVTTLFAVLLLVGVGNARQATTQYERALINAAKEGNASQVRGLLEVGTDPNVTDEHGNTPLIYAAKENLAAVDMLLFAGASVNAKDNQAHNALVQTKIDKNTEVATFLERYGLTTTNKDARTIEKVHLTQEELDAKHELWKAQQGEEENVGKTFLKGVAEAGAATLQYGIENNKF